MPRYLFVASYTADGVEGVLTYGGTARRAAVEKTVTSLGGRLESFYFAFGEADVYVLAELPDNSAAAALALTVNASGRIHVRTVALLTPEEIDAAGKLEVTYSGPGNTYMG